MKKFALTCIQIAGSVRLMAPTGRVFIAANSNLKARRTSPIIIDPALSSVEFNVCPKSEDTFLLGLLAAVVMAALAAATYSLAPATIERMLVIGKLFK